MTNTASKSLYEEYIKEMQTIADLRYARLYCSGTRKPIYHPRARPFAVNR